MPMPNGSVNGVKTMEIVGAGEKEFGEFAFTQVGTYVYKIYEVDTGVEGYTYDKTIYTLTAEVTLEGTALKLDKVYTRDDGVEADPVFTNEYEKPTPPPVTPPTGDISHPVFYGAIMIGALGAAGLLMKKRREEIE